MERLRDACSPQTARVPLALARLSQHKERDFYSLVRVARVQSVARNNDKLTVRPKFFVPTQTYNLRTVSVFLKFDPVDYLCNCF